MAVSCWSPVLAVLALLLCVWVAQLLAVDVNPSQLLDQEKKAYLSRLDALYSAAGLDSRDVDKAALLGHISDMLNSFKPPREQCFIKRHDIYHWSSTNGSFKASLVVDSLVRGLEHCSVEGAFDPASLRFEATLLKCGSTVKKDDPSFSWHAPTLKAGNENGYNNGSNGIPELEKLGLATHCKRNVLDECERGSVTMDTWVNQTLSFQRALSGDTPLNLVQLLASHNSFNNKADGYGTGDFTLGQILELLSGGDWQFVWAQQWLTMTDQLGLGVRRLMLDPTYLWGAMRLCHCGTTFKWFNRVIDYIDKVLNTTIPFDSNDLGCTPYDRTFESGVQEIADWVGGHEEQLVWVYVNDEGADHDWGHQELITAPVRELLGDLLFTPSDKEQLFPHSWPSPNQLFQLGKRVIVSGTERCANEVIFADVMVPGWDRDTVKYFTPYPVCGGYTTPGQWYIVGGESQVVGPIYNGPAEEGLVVPDNLPYLLQCPVSTVSMDLVSPDLLRSAIWSWAPSHSVKNITNTSSAAMDLQQEGRWVTLPSASLLPCACQNTSNTWLDLVVGLPARAWQQAKCPSGYAFFVPISGYENWQLYQAALRALQHTSFTALWINIKH